MKNRNRRKRSILVHRLHVAVKRLTLACLYNDQASAASTLDTRPHNCSWRSKSECPICTAAETSMEAEVSHYTKLRDRILSYLPGSDGQAGIVQAMQGDRRLRRIAAEQLQAVGYLQAVNVQPFGKVQPRPMISVISEEGYAVESYAQRERENRDRIMDHAAGLYSQIKSVHYK